MDPLKTEEEQKGLFYSDCSNFANVFRSMFNPIKNESYVLNLLGSLNLLREEKQRRGREDVLTKTTATMTTF